MEVPELQKLMQVHLPARFRAPRRDERVTIGKRARRGDGENYLGWDVYVHGRGAGPARRIRLTDWNAYVSRGGGSVARRTR